MLTEVVAFSLLTLLSVILPWWKLPSILYKYYRQWKLLRSVHPPSCHPNQHWLLGHIPYIYKQDEEVIKNVIDSVNDPTNKDVHLLKTWLGPIPIVSVSHSEDLPKILKEPKSRLMYSGLLPWLGEGLLLAGGKKWFRNRRLLTPAFHYEILKGYVSVYNSCLSVLLDKWSNSTRKGIPVLLFDTLGSMSLDIIMQCAFSFKSDCQRANVQLPYVRACSDLVYLCSDRIMNPLYMIDWFYWLTPHGKKMRKTCNLVHEHAKTVIAERKASLCNNKKQETCTKENGRASKYLDFLDILLIARDEEGNGMSDLEIRTEVDTFMFEGHDTTTSAMSWTLYCLAQHPQHQDKIREEVRCVLNSRKWLEYDDLKQLNYTMWCIKEAMRLYPPVFFFFRRTTEETQLNGHLIPRDINLVIFLLLIHRNANIWENPMVYDPLRFQPSNMEKHGPYDYIPFSAGSRNCIGQNFAMNEMKVVIGTIVNHFSLKVDETHHVEMVPRVVLRSKNDIKLFLEPYL